MPHNFENPHDNHTTLTCSTAPTMRLFRGLVLFLLLIVSCVAAPTPPRVKTSDPEVARRWYSVPDDRDMSPNRFRAWPARDDVTRPIFYCFADVHAYNTLNHIFELALAKWAPAIRVSSLEFAPHPACPQEPCLCSEPDVGAETTLHIMLGDKDLTGVASMGYIPPFIPIPAGMTRNFLRWPSDPSYSSRADAPRNMAHEIGKCLGI